MNCGRIVQLATTQMRSLNVGSMLEGGGVSENGEHTEEKEFSGVMHPRDPVEGR